MPARRTASRAPIPDPAAAATSTPRTVGSCRHETQEAAKEPPERKRVMLYLDPDVYEALKAFATKRRLSMNVAATLAVEAMLETEDV